MTRAALLLALACGAALPAQAYCVHNQLADRVVRVEQEDHRRCTPAAIRKARSPW